MYSIHLIDDSPEFEEIVKNALYADGTCEEIVSFRYFTTVGEAIQHYQNHLDSYPDVALVDLDFTNPWVPEGEDGPLKGLVLIDFISKHHPATKVFAFTGYDYKDEVGEAIDRLNLLNTVISKGNQVGAQMRVPVWNVLKDLARQGVANLDQNYQNELRVLPDDFAEKRVGNTGFTLRQFLAGWGDVAQKTQAEVQAIILDLLGHAIRPVIFMGNWSRPDSPERLELSKYINLSRPEYESVLKDINRKAFDLLIELIHINDTYDIASTNVQLSYTHFHLFSVTRGVKGNPKAFWNKLVGRRALLAFEKIDRRSGLSLDGCAFLLRDTRLNPYTLDKNDDSLDALRGSVVNTNLGLSIGERFSLRMEPAYLLSEEMEFVEVFGTHAQKFADLLSILHIPGALRHYLDGEDLYNLSELKAFIEKLHAQPELKTAAVDFHRHFFTQTLLQTIPLPIRQAVFGLYGIDYHVK